MSADTNLIEWYNKLRKSNQQMINQWKNILHTYSFSVPLFVLGSHGRYESSQYSYAEFIVFTTDSFSNQDIYKEIKESVGKLLGLSYYNIEQKNLTNPTSMVHYNNNTACIFPMRCYDAIPLVESENGKDIYYKILESIARYSNPKRVIKKIKDRKREYKNVCLKGQNKIKQKVVRHIDLEKGVLYYNPEKMSYGVKYGPLRLLHTTLELLITKSLFKNSDREINETKVILTFSPIDRLLFYTSYLKNFQKDHYDDLKATYAYFLKYHHLLQEKYYLLSVKEHIIDDLKEFKERIEFMIKMCELE